MSFERKIKMKLILLCVCAAFLPSILSKRTHQLVFPEADGFPYAQLHGTIDHQLEDFTLCHWSRVNARNQNWGSIFSYAVSTMDNTIVIMTNQSGVVGLWRNSLHSSVGTGADRTKWLHTCTTWTTVENKWEFFINGAKKGSGKGTNNAKPVPPNGIVILGQEQDSLGGTFDPNQALKGQIADLNLWDRVLTSHEISRVHACTFAEEGNVISWNLHSWNLFNGVRIQPTTLPCSES